MTTKMPFAAALAAGVLLSASALAQQGPMSSPQGTPRDGMAAQPRDSRLGQPAMAEPDRAQRERMSPQAQTERPQAQRSAQYSANQVRQAQESLNARGYAAGPVDGMWGPQTSSAVRQFQQAQGMQATGQLNAQTAEALGVQAGAARGSQVGENPDMQRAPRSRAPGTQPGSRGSAQQPAAPGATRGSSNSGATNPANPSRDMPGTPARPTP